MKRYCKLKTGIKFVLLILSLLLVHVSPAQAAFGVGGATCTAQSKTAGTSLACTVATENLDAGNIAILWFAGDNTAITDGNDGLLSSVADSAGNIWTVQRCFTNAQGGAENGATTCIATSKLTTTLTSGVGTITATFASIVAKAIVVKEFTVGAGNTIAVVGTPQDLANDNADPGSMTISGLTNSQHLFVRSTALERQGGTWTVTAGYTTSGCTYTTGPPTADGQNMDICGEFRILTATTDTSNPTGTAVDSASIFIAFDEVTVGAPSKLAFYVQPSTTAGGAAISPSVQVEIQDASGNQVTTATNAVTMAIGTNPGCPSNCGTLSGTLTVNAVAGIATFSNLSIDIEGVDYTLTASATGLTGAISNMFNIVAGTFGTTVCAGQRYGSDLNCTAGDVKITNISIAPTTPTSSCTGGETITVDLDITINFNQAGKYDVGVFMSNNGLDPQKTVANGGATSCNVSILPIPPASDQFENNDGGATGDTCGEGSSGRIGILRMTTVTVKCHAVSGSSGNLFIPFVVSWDVNKTPPGKVCTSIADPVPSQSSKCNSPVGSDLQYGVITGTAVLPSITKTDNKTTLSPGESTTYTVVITNATGVTLTNAVFKDTVDPTTGALTLTPGGTTCSASGGATCPVSCCDVSAMQATGLTIPSMLGNSPQAIRGITQANPAVINYSGADTYANGDKVIISDVVGMTEVNDKEFTVANVNTGANTFELSGVNSTGYTAYTSGGTILKISSLTFTINATVSGTPPASFTNTATVTVGSAAASASDTTGGSGSGSGGGRVRVIKWREVFQ